MPPRRRYKLTSNADRERLLRAHNQGKDTLETARLLGIKEDTAYRIVKSGRPEMLQKGGPRNVKITQEMKEYLSECLGENPLITLQQIKTKLITRFPQCPNVSLSTIKNSLDGLFYTLKKAVDQPANRNSARVKNLRLQYAVWLMEEGVNSNLIFIDEIGCNMWTRRSYGRAIRGRPCYRVVGNQRGQNQTMCMAINKDEGLIHFELLNGSMTSERFSQFLLNMSHAVDNREFTIILDNARPHHGEVEVPDNFRLKFLAPYSPFLNPIENVFSVMKANMKRQLAVVDIREDERAQEQGLSLVAYRRNLLRNVMLSSIDEVTPQLCLTYYNRIFPFTPMCFAEEDIQF